MSGGRLPTTGIALGGTALTIGGYQINWLLAIIAAAAAVVALGFMLFRMGYRRDAPAPITVSGPVDYVLPATGETAVVPRKLLEQHRPGARQR